MRRFVTIAASLVMAMAMLTAPDILAQSRSTGGSTTRSAGTSSQSTSRSSGSQSTVRSSGSQSTSRSSASQSTSRSSGTAASSQSTVRSSSSQSTSRSSAAQSTTRSSSSQSTSRSSGSQSQSTSRSSGGTTVRSSAGSSSSSSAVSSSSSSSARSAGSSSSTVRSTSQDKARSSAGTAVSSSSSSSSVSTRSNSGSSSSSSSNVVTGTTVRSSNVSRSGLSSNTETASSTTAVSPTYRDDSYNYRYNDDMRVDDTHNMYRVAPRHRDPMPWDRPGNFWGDHPHYYGYRVHSLPPSWRRISHWGMDYYYYNGIYYRPFGGSYVVCRPPFGTPLERAIDRAVLRAIRFAYYCDTYRTYSRAFDYYNVIARQNQIIAQQNARLIAMNSGYALNANRALSAYELANQLGLVQSYAYANSEYYYQDGVFYTISPSGVFTTIVPPAGALVTSLPDDYEVIVMNGIEYYMVDNTVYRTTLFDGVPYLEVLGQMYGSLYTQYNVYR